MVQREVIYFEGLDEKPKKNSHVLLLLILNCVQGAKYFSTNLLLLLIGGCI